MGDGTAGLVIYFIEAIGTNRVKIGYTKQTVNQRLAMLRTGSSVELNVIRELDGGPSAEKSLHRFFASARRNGEWFNLEQVQSMISEVGEDRLVEVAASPPPRMNTLSVRLEDGDLERAEELAAMLSKQAEGAPITVGDAVRAAMRAGFKTYLGDIQ